MHISHEASGGILVAVNIATGADVTGWLSAGVVFGVGMVFGIAVVISLAAGIGVMVGFSGAVGIWVLI